MAHSHKVVVQRMAQGETGSCNKSPSSDSSCIVTLTASFLLPSFGPVLGFGKQWPIQAGTWLVRSYGRNFFMLGWHEIRMVLYNNLPAGTVEHGRRVVGYEEDSDGFIRLKFKVLHASIRNGGGGGGGGVFLSSSFSFFPL